MITGVVLALLASVFTASASITQRFAAAPDTSDVSFNLQIVRELIRKPIWFIGILCMIIGFGFQVDALRVSSLNLVQPVIAIELLLVFGFLAIRSPGRVQKRDWAAAAAMGVGLTAFLAIAHPEGASDQASFSHWAVAGLATFVAAAIFWTLAQLPGRGRRGRSPARQAALLATAAGVAWGFVAAVIKELSGHISQGPYAVFTNWSPYVLLVAGAGAFFLLSNAFKAGPLAASQPCLTIIDPLVASILGVSLFGETIRHGPIEMVGEGIALLVLLGGVVLLSRSPLLQGESAERAESSPVTGVIADAPVDEDTVARRDVPRKAVIRESVTRESVNEGGASKDVVDDPRTEHQPIVVEDEEGLEDHRSRKGHGGRYGRRRKEPVGSGLRELAGFGDVGTG